MSSQRFYSSIDFFADCFPTLFTHIPTALLDSLFPVRTTKYCPTPVGTIFGNPINWPNLLYPCLFGILIGFFGFYECSHLSLSSPPPSPSRFSNFSLSCLFFSLMNISAFMTHCYTVPQSSEWQPWYCLDMVCTSTSSLFMALSCFEGGVPKLIQKASYAYFFAAYYVLWTYEIQQKRLLWIPEFLYIFVTGVCASCVFWKVLVPNLLSGTYLNCLLPSLNGLALFIVSVPLDSTLCDILGSPYGNLLTPAFIGCDVAFAGLIGYVISRDDEEFERKFKEQERVKKERELKKEV
ncbi:hypothetical protein TrVE_jg11489 [Triparma verrucosa]|uniref:Uncharacterized protein n=1 Tax=Triparma verrucosa TaxID=1606542 RepID=A0A9W7CCA2_9STRA|nr:hypothetical protein TrVE_jg11489 [Triparma verrucosa]